MSVIVFIIVLAILVLVHELGHFSVAKFFGIKVSEFGFGFPPRIWGVKKGETTYSVNWIPFGGFVKILGEDAEEANPASQDARPDSVGFRDGAPKDPADVGRRLTDKSRGVQAAVMVAGVTFNFLLAWFLMSVGFMAGLPTSVGSMPFGDIQNPQLVITGTLPGSPAQSGGLESGDEIVSLDSATSHLTRETIGVTAVQDLIAASLGAPVSVSIRKNGMNVPTGPVSTVSISPRQGVVGGNFAIGISMDMIGTLKLPPHKAVYAGLIASAYLVKGMALGLYHFIAGFFSGSSSLSAVSGPVGLIGIVGEAYGFGIIYLISFMALISVNLAVLNLLPLPALDGGRAFILLLEAIRRKPFDQKIVGAIHVAGFLALLCLMAVVTWSDVAKLLQ